MRGQGHNPGDWEAFRQKIGPPNCSAELLGFLRRIWGVVETHAIFVEPLWDGKYNHPGDNPYVVRTVFNWEHGRPSRVDAGAVAFYDIPNWLDSQIGARQSLMDTMNDDQTLGNTDRMRDGYSVNFDPLLVNFNSFLLNFNFV